MSISVRISTGGVTHTLKHNGMTLCGKHFHSGSKGNWDDKVTCKSCIKAEYKLRQHIASGPCHELCEVHPKPEVTEDDDSGCEGHESLSGAHMGETVFCDGSCVRTVVRSVEANAQAEGAAYGKAGKALVGNCSWSGEAAKLAFTHGWMTHHESCDCKISGGIGYTYDCATHEMVKNPPARQYTPHEMSLARRRYEPGTWRSKHKGSKGKRMLSHA